ncbi:MAG: AGE family epimerase/isomerase [Micavibrio sp.]
MNFGTHSTVEYLAIRLLHRWVPKWYEAFSDQKIGGFYERLGHSFQPVLTGTRRLLTQCRQLSVYSHASLQKDGTAFNIDLKKSFDHIVKAYYIPATGAWRFSVDDQGNPNDETCDLYTLSFVIFSFSHYFRATGDARAKDMASATLHLIEKYFRLDDQPGFAEALDGSLKTLPNMRRQNPHMHLLEACLFAYDTWHDPAFLKTADEMVALFQRYFYNSDTNTVCEFFTDDLQPHPDKGDRVEPGHAFEWVWLLKRHAEIKQDPKQYDDICSRLLNWGNRYGWDSAFGGIYDVLSPRGDVLVETKRLWPFTEGLKANALMLDSFPDKDPIKEQISRMVHIFRSKYMQERGFWVEWLSRDLKPQSDYMPGTTPYHVYFGIMETRRHLHARGYSVSLAAPLVIFIYKIRRALSGRARMIRLALKRSGA